MMRFAEKAVSVRRRVAAGGIGLLAAFGFTACGEADGTEGGSEEASASASAAAAEADGGSQPGTGPQDPVEPGGSAEIGEWTVAIGEVAFDVADELVAFSDINREPFDGKTYVLIELRATYNGDGAADPYTDFTWGLWDGAEVIDHEPGLFLPEDLAIVGEIESGETASGNIALEIPEGDHSEAMVVIGELMGDDVYFAIA
ncbi:hypothetical protein GCM10027447_15100 [Glycomyces halotolerans]